MLAMLAGCTEPEAPRTDLDGSWPQWRGPGRDGRVVAPALDAWAAGDRLPRDVWRARLGAGFSGLAVSAPPDQRLFTTWVDDAREVLGALDVHDGAVLWTVPLGEVKGSSHGDGPRSTPLVTDDGVVFAMGSFGDLVAVRAADGSEVWRRPLRSLAEGDEPDWGFSASPLVDAGPQGDRLLIHLGGPASILALDPQTGDVIWQTESYRGYASPRMVELAGRRQLLSATGWGVLGLDPASGDVLWQRRWETYYGLNAADPVPLPGDRIFLSAHYNTGALLLRVVAPAGPDGDWTTEDVWTSRRLRNHYATSLYWPEHDLLVGFDGDFLAAVDGETGELLWKARGTGKGQALRIEPRGEIPARLLVLTDGCEVQLGTIDRQSWTPVARHELELGGTCFAVPSLVGGRLFARDGRHAVAVDLAPS